MRCDIVRELFSEIYDKRAEDQDLLVEHIKNCSSCANEYQEFSQLMDALRELPEPALPDSFHKTAMSNIQAILAQESHISRHNRRKANRAALIRQWAGVAAAACLLFACLWAVRTFDFASRHDNELSAYVAPQSSMDSFSIAESDMAIYDAPTDRFILSDEEDWTDEEQFAHRSYDGQCPWPEDEAHSTGVYEEEADMLWGSNQAGIVPSVGDIDIAEFDIDDIDALEHNLVPAPSLRGGFDGFSDSDQDYIYGIVGGGFAGHADEFTIEIVSVAGVYEYSQSTRARDIVITITLVVVAIVLGTVFIALRKKPISQHKEG